jgi:hypothetical protein
MLFRDRPLVVNLCYITVAHSALSAAARFTAIVEDEKRPFFGMCTTRSFEHLYGHADLEANRKTCRSPECLR